MPAAHTHTHTHVTHEVCHTLTGHRKVLHTSQPHNTPLGYI